MSGPTYYQKNRPVILNGAKDYYENNKEVLREREKNKYIKISEEEKDVNKQYQKKPDIITCLMKISKN